MALGRPRGSKNRFPTRYLQLHRSYRTFLNQKRQSGYDTKTLALLGGFPDPNVWATQFFGPFPLTDLNTARWRQLATALGYGGTLVEDAPSPSMEATA